jgi:hypothetical protein
MPRGCGGFYSPDAESLEEAISKFMEGMELQESSGFQNINRLIHGLPVPDTRRIGPDSK